MGHIFGSSGGLQDVCSSCTPIWAAEIGYCTELAHFWDPFKLFWQCVGTHRLEAVGKHQRAKKSHGCDLASVSLLCETCLVHRDCIHSMWAPWPPPPPPKSSTDLFLFFNTQSLNGEKMWEPTLRQKQRCVLSRYVGSSIPLFTPHWLGTRTSQSRGRNAQMAHTTRVNQ